MWKHVRIVDLRLTEYQKRELEKFATHIWNQVSWHPIKLLVFGSAARGRSFAFSDIDVAVLSNVFEKMPWEIRLDHLETYLDPGSPISPVGVTSEELNRGPLASPSILRSIRPQQAVQIDN